MHIKFILKQTSTNHNFYIKSSFSKYDSDRRGRPFGGTCWAIKKNIIVKNNTFYDHNISSIEIKTDSNKNVVFYGVWLPFDNKTDEKLSSYKNDLSLLKSLYKNNLSNYQLFIGDFNASFNRNPATRFDKLLREFVRENNLINVVEVDLLLF